MGGPLIEYLGWLATAVFVGSYLCKRSAALSAICITWIRRRYLRP